jgi:hypothetical protein
VDVNPEPCAVLVLGDYYVDIVFTGLPNWPRLGDEVVAQDTITVPGGAFTHARALHRLGIAARWAADLGTDTYSEVISAAVTREGLDTSAFVRRDHPVRNLSVAVVHDGDRGFISFKEPVAERNLAALIVLHRPSVVLVAELMPRHRFAAVASAARTVGARLVLDPQHTECTVDDPALRRTLSELDVFLPNAAEAQHLTGTGTVEAAVEVLADLVPAVVVKTGADGALGTANRQTVVVPAPAVTVVDTIGAGDCFDAGFVAAYAHASSFRACVELATLCGALSTRGPGGSAAPTLTEITERAPHLAPWAQHPRLIVPSASRDALPDT